MSRYTALCLNALAKLQNPREASRHPTLMGNCSTCSHMLLLYQSTKWFIISPFEMVWVAWDSVTTRELPVEKKVDMKFMQVNVLKDIARMTRRLYVLIMSHTRFRVNLHCSGLNVKEPLAQNTRDIWRLSDCNGMRICNHLVCKRKLNHLGKLVKRLNG